VFLLVVYNALCCVWLLMVYGKRVFVAVVVARPLAVCVAVCLAVSAVCGLGCGKRCCSLHYKQKI
jgi:hypothetical protein